MTTAATSFGLARMSRLILVLTVGLLALPIVLLAGAARGERALAVPGLVVVAVYAWVWLRFRPTRFVVRPDVLEVVWPLKRRQIPRREISGLRLLDGKGLRREIGWGLRIGAGGLWGGFGWLWTRKRGTVQMYISRTDGFVWIERSGGRPWLVTPERPEAFVRALSG